VYNPGNRQEKPFSGIFLFTQMDKCDKIKSAG